ncbi:ABC transporter permease, partial [Gemmatimonadota bacterium]
MMNHWLQRIASWVLGREEARALSSEMEELYRCRVEREGAAAAKRWQRRQRRKMLKHLLVGGLRRGSLKNAGHSRKPTGPGWVTGFRVQLRGLARAPVFAGSVAGTLALGIGGITTVFGVVHAVLLNPLPYPESQELVQISNSSKGQQWPLSVADYLAIEEQQTQFEGVGAMASGQATYSRDSGSDRMLVHLVTPGLFPLLGVQPTHGRVFFEEERNPGAPPVVVLGWDFWNREFRGDPSRMGENVRIDGQEVPVVGVLPAQVGPSLEDADIIFPLQLVPPQRKGPFFLDAFGRLGEGVDAEAASAELVAINERIFPIWVDSWQDQEATWLMTDLRTRVVGDVGPSLLVILGAAIFVLIMVCANAASLLLARILDRRRELAVRAALGASRGNLVAQLVAESGLLVVIGSLGGLGLAILGIRLTSSFGAPFIPRTSEVAFSGPVLLFFLAMSVASLVMFGLLPALKAPAAQVSEGLREGGARTGASAWTGKARNLLVTIQFAVSVPILVGGGLLVGSFLALTQVDPGFDADRVLALDVSLSADDQRTKQELNQVWEQLLQEIGSLPGVARAGVGQGRPPGDHPLTNNFVLEDQPVAEGETQPSVPWVFASEAYFDALGAGLVAGRMFGPLVDNAPRVALVDEAFARRFYSGPEDAL